MNRTDLMEPVQCYCQEEDAYKLYSDNRNHGLLLNIKMYTWILSSAGSLKNWTITLYTQRHFPVNLFGFSRSHQITSIIKGLLFVMEHSSFLQNGGLFIYLHNHIICINYSVNTENKWELCKLTSYPIQWNSYLQIQSLQNSRREKITDHSGRTRCC
jgi:hypothetical protein